MLHGVVPCRVRAIEQIEGGVIQEVAAVEPPLRAPCSPRFLHQYVQHLVLRVRPARRPRSDALGDHRWSQDHGPMRVLLSGPGLGLRDAVGVGVQRPCPDLHDRPLLVKQALQLPNRLRPRHQRHRRQQHLPVHRQGVNKPRQAVHPRSPRGHRHRVLLLRPLRVHHRPHHVVFVPGHCDEHPLLLGERERQHVRGLGHLVGGALRVGKREVQKRGQSVRDVGFGLESDVRLTRGEPEVGLVAPVLGEPAPEIDLRKKSCRIRIRALHPEMDCKLLRLTVLLGKCIHFRPSKTLRAGRINPHGLCRGAGRLRRVQCTPQIIVD
mmetsp:Transcript_7114/g.15182  ORF Transcript_7114/g.15182 Transcript_7114/m.15182 type:complete len:323 (+) Transcript_7114:2029-2997(+)